MAGKQTTLHENYSMFVFSVSVLLWCVTEIQLKRNSEALLSSASATVDPEKQNDSFSWVQDLEFREYRS